MKKPFKGTDYKEENMKQTRLWLIALLACVMAVTGVFAFAPQALAEETSVGNVIDMRETDLVEVPVQREGEQSFEESALADYVWSHNGEVSFTGTKPFFDGEKSITFKLLFPYQVKFAAMQIMLDAGGKISFSQDGVTWNEEDAILKQNPEWAEEDITQYLGHDEENQQDVVFVRIEDATPADGSGPIVRILNFICAQVYDYSDDTVELPALTEETEDKFVVLPGDEDSTEENYLITQNGETSAGGFRFFDGAGALYNAVRDTYATGYSWSRLAVYKFTYSEQALALQLKVEIAGQYRIEIATELDETLDSTFYDADALTANGAPWTRVAVDYFELVPEHYVTVDISQFMENNADRTIYVKVSDPTSWYGNGACLFSMSLIETRKAAAPAVTVNEEAVTEVASGQSLDLSTLFTVQTADDQAVYAYTVNGEAVDGATFEAGEEGSYTVGLTVTDANGSTGNAEAEVTVLPAVATGIALKSAPTVTEYKTGAELDLTGAVITVTYSDGSTQDVEVTASMVSGYDAETSGEQTVTVTYEGFTATFTVTVKAGGCGGQVGAGFAEGILLLALAGFFLAAKRIREK